MSEAVRASDKPFNVAVESGRTYYWCACGRSQKQPFCDGSHKDTGLEPLRYDAKEDGELWFCGCKATDNAPLCDGAHKKPAS